MTTTLDTLSLPPDLAWTDEFADWAVTQSARRTLDGGLVLYEQRLLAGRPITLQSQEDAGWVTRAVVQQLYALADQPGQSWTLTIRGQAFRVAFRRTGGTPALEADEVVTLAYPAPDHYYRITLRLITTEE